MKKILTLLSSFAVSATGVSTVVACGKEDEKDLSKLTDIITFSSEKTVADFNTKLIKALIKGTKGFDKMSDKTINIFKKDTETALEPGDIVTLTEITVKPKGEGFTGLKNIKVTWSTKSGS